MSWPRRHIVWTRAANRALTDLARRDSRRAAAIRAQLRQYADFGIGDIRKLAARPGEYRLRVGSWRVIFSFGREPTSGEPAIFVLRVDDRRDAYRA